MPQDRRAPARPRKIEHIDPRDDIRVRIVCTVLEKGEDSVMVDDGTGTTEVFLDRGDLQGIEENDRVRIIGRVLPTPESFEIQGELLQSMQGVDMDLYDEVRTITSQGV